MAYATRCPQCGTKLQLDEAPAADEAVECPKCGTQFSPAESAAARPPLPEDLKKKSAAKDDKPAAKKKAKDAGLQKKRKVKKKSNPVILGLMVLGAMVILACIGAMGYLLLSTSGKIEEMLSYVPGDCNHVRGVNVQLLGKYPGYKSEMEKQTNVGIKDYADALAKAAGAAPEEFLDYAVVAKKKDRGTGTVTVLRTRKPIDPKAVLAAVGSPQAIDGKDAARGSSGRLAGATIIAPTNRLLVVVTGANQDALARASAGGGPAQKENSFYGKIGDTGQVVTRGNIWLLIRAEGDLRTFIKDMGEGVKSSHKSLADQTAKAKVWGSWVSFGSGGVRFGAGVECDSPEAASSVATACAEGPLGKGDDSEIPNDMKTAFTGSGSKEFKSDFLANLKFSSSRACAYFTSKMLQTKASSMLSLFNNPAMGDAAANTGGGRGGGPGTAGGPP